MSSKSWLYVVELTAAVPDWALGLLFFNLAPGVKVALADSSRSPRRKVIVLQP